MDNHEIKWINKLFLFILLTLLSCNLFADGNNTKKRDIGFGSGGDYYSVEYEEQGNKAYYSIIITSQEGFKMIMKMVSTNKAKIKQLYSTQSSPNDLLLVFTIYTSVCEEIETNESQLILLLDLDS